jgi:superfamily II DNA or RNA helicase
MRDDNLFEHSSRKAREVVITLGGRLMRVEPWITDLECKMRFKRHIYNPFNKTPETKYESLFEVSDGVGYLLPGLYSKTLSILEHKGYLVTLKDLRRHMPLQRPDTSRLGSLRDGQGSLLEAISTNHSGVIVAPTGFGKSFCIVQLCKMYPKSRFIISTPRQSVVKTIYDRLMSDSYLKKHTGIMCSSKKTGFDHRIVVTTPVSMARCETHSIDFLIIDECHCVGAEKISEAIARFPDCRKIGLSASPTGRGDRADIVLEAVIGKEIFNYDYQDAVESGSIMPINVIIKEVKKGPAIFNNRLALKRRGIWLNSERNKIIADTVSSYGDKQTLIMVETVEHMMALRRLLPGWTTVYGAGLSKEEYMGYVSNGFTDEPWRTNADLRKIQDDFASGVLRKVIATMVWREGVDMPHLEVLCRADALSGKIPSIQIPGRLSRIQDGKDSVTLIDFLDLFDVELQRASESRIRAYRDKQWKVDFV